MKWLMDLYREFTSFEGSLFKYSLSFSLLLALAPSLLLIAMLFRFAYLPMDIIMKFLISFMPDMSMDGLDQVFSVFCQSELQHHLLYCDDVCILLSGKQKHLFLSPDQCVS